MKNLLLIVGGIILSTIAYSQVKEFKIAPDVTATKAARYTKGTFEIYGVSLRTIDMPTYDTAYVETQSYIDLKEQIEKLKSDSIELNDKYLAEMSEFQEVSTIRKNIVTFLKSGDKFKDKKDLLLEAQTTAKKYNIDVFVYADKTINQQKIGEFMKLKMDSKALNEHLNLVQSNLFHTIREPIKPASFEFTDLSNARKRLSKTERYEMKLTKSGSSKIEALVVGDEIKDLTSISGVFHVVEHRYEIGNNGQLTKQGERSSNESYGLMEDSSTGRLLYGTCNFIYNCGTEVTLVNFLAKLNELGFSTEQKGEDVYINNTNVKLTHSIYENVSAGNVDYLNVVMSSAKKLNSLLAEAAPLNDKLVNHFNAYQHGTLTTDRLNTWKKEVANGQGIIKKIGELPNIDKYSLGDYTTIKNLEMYVEFSNVVKGSATILGQ